MTNGYKPVRGPAPFKNGLRVHKLYSVEPEIENWRIDYRPEPSVLNQWGVDYRGSLDDEAGLAHAISVLNGMIGSPVVTIERVRDFVA